MRIILLTDVPGTGVAGDIKEVKNGYARNFLLPKELAVPATHDQVQRIKTIRKTAEEQRLKEEQDLQALADRLAQTALTLTARLGPTGRFYGAITSSQIAEQLSRLIEREIDRRSIQLAEPIHEPGTYQAEVRLGHGISATLQVTTQGQAQAEAQAREEPAAQAEPAPAEGEPETPGENS